MSFGTWHLMNAARAAMNTTVFSKFDRLRFEETEQNVERTSRSYLEVIDGQHSDLLTSHKVMDGTEALKHRRNGYVCVLYYTKCIQQSKCDLM